MLKLCGVSHLGASWHVRHRQQCWPLSNHNRPNDNASVALADCGSPRHQIAQVSDTLTRELKLFRVKAICLPITGEQRE